MSDRARRRQCVALRSFSAVPSGSLAVIHAFLLLTIALLPVQMRAGASESHPHSILQLVLDARDGVIDHHGHAPGYVSEHDAHGSDPVACVVDSDLPSIEETGRLGGISLLAVPLVLMIIPGLRAERTWPAPQPWPARQPELDPPPPRSRGTWLSPLT